MLKVLDCPVRPLRFTVALATALLLFCLPAAASEEGSSSDTSTTVVTVAQCSAECHVPAGTWIGNVYVAIEYYNSTSITVSWNDVDDLHNCTGTLTNGNC